MILDLQNTKSIYPLVICYIYSYGKPIEIDDVAIKMVDLSMANCHQPGIKKYCQASDKLIELQIRTCRSETGAVLNVGLLDGLLGVAGMMT